MKELVQSLKELLTGKRYFEIVTPLINLPPDKHLTELSAYQRALICSALEYLWNIADLASGRKISVHPSVPIEEFLPTMNVTPEEAERLKTARGGAGDRGQITLEFDRQGALIIEERYTKREVVTLGDPYGTTISHDRPTVRKFRLRELTQDDENEIRIGQFSLSLLQKTAPEGDHIHIISSHPDLQDITNDPFRRETPQEFDITKEIITAMDIARLVIITYKGLTRQQAISSL